MEQNTHNDPSEELLKCFDDEGNVIEPQKRKLVHTKPLSIWHSVTVIWMMNDQGQILCTKRAETNEGNPGKWQTYVGGHREGRWNYFERRKRVYSYSTTKP